MENRTKSEQIMRVQRRKKEFAVRAFGGKCQVCGYSKCLGALEFHHVDASTKEQKPAYIIMRWKWERAKTELDKCVLLCANCHREAEAKEIPDEVLIRQRLVPFIQRDCKFCRKPFETKVIDQTFCSMTCATMSSRKTERPTKEQLSLLIKEYSWVAIGRMYDVSDNAVRKWAKRYNIYGSVA